jgi:transglutaminase-like putative cysteine protease
MTFKITHRTTYTYEDQVTLSYGLLHMIPRDLPGQACRSAAIRIEPRPDFYRERLDFFGNRVGYFEIRTAHRRLSVLSTSEVEIDSSRRQPSADPTPWETVRDRLAAGRPLLPPADNAPAARVAAPPAWPESEDLDARQFVLGSPLASPSSSLQDYALGSFTPGRPVHEALFDLTQRVHDDFRYEPGATSVTTTVEEAFEKRAGVCQDFAHVVIGCLRSLNLAALYVSGYLETSPPPGRDRLSGADVSHAWASLFVPGDGWVDVDPTNRRFANDRYTTTAWGRDYGDVPPLKGVIFTESTEHDLEVAVDVVRVQDT